jgi:hypothetical protein
VATISDASGDAANDDEFGGLDRRQDPGSPDRLLWAAIGMVVVGAALHAAGVIALNAVGYLLAAPLPFTLVTLFRRLSLERLVSVGIAPSPIGRPLTRAILAMGFVVAVIHVIVIASHYA